MEIRQLETFRTVAMSLSFTQAAAQLNYAQSSVSAQIQALEDELGVQLFDRLGRRVQLTDQGRQLLVYAERILQLAEEARLSLTNSEVPSGELRIGAPETLCVYRLAALLRPFHELYPQVRVTLHPTMAIVWRQQLREGQLDGAIEFTISRDVEGFHTEPLIREEMLLVTHPDHRLASRQVVQPADLQDETFLLPEPGANYRVMFERYLHARGVRPGDVLDFMSVEAIKQCVIGGMGITFLPRMAVAAEIEAGRLRPLPLPDLDFQVYTQIVLHPDKWVSPALAAFLDVVRQKIPQTVETA